MTKRFYQIDRYANEASALDGISDMAYKMVESTSRKQALTDYITSNGDDIADYVIGKTNVKGGMEVSATCPIETTAILTARVAAQ